jgi:hypothetical protein
MTKIALITDQHFGARGDNLAFHDFFEKFYSEVFFPYIDKHNISHIIDLGDTFDRRKFINFNTLHRCQQYWFDQIESRPVQLDLIVGNHCTFFKNTNDVNSPDLLLSGYKNISVFAEPAVIRAEDDTEIVLMPWICQDNTERALELINTTSAQILFGHLEVAGFEMYKGAVVEHGMDRSVFDKFDVVCSGHFHHRSTKGNLTYLGCPYEMTWSDYGDTKGFHVFDTETRELEFIPNPFNMFVKVHYDDVGMTTDSIRDLDFSHLKSTYVKLIIHAKNNPYLFDLFVDAVSSAEPISIQIVDDNQYLQLEDDDSIVDEAEDTLTILKKFIAGSESSIDKLQVDKLINDLYFEASSL